MVNHIANRKKCILCEVDEGKKYWCPWAGLKNVVDEVHDISYIELENRYQEKGGPRQGRIRTTESKLDNDGMIYKVLVSTSQKDWVKSDIDEGTRYWTPQVRRMQRENVYRKQGLCQRVGISASTVRWMSNCPRVGRNVSMVILMREVNPMPSSRMICKKQ